MTTISRRTLIGAMAALPATAAPGRAWSLLEAPVIAPPLQTHPLAGLRSLEVKLSELVGVRNRMYGGKWELRVRAPDDDYPDILYINVGSLTPQNRVAMAQRELIEAKKALHPDIDVWTVYGDDHSREAPGFFFCVGKRSKAVQS